MSERTDVATRQLNNCFQMAALLEREYGDEQETIGRLMRRVGEIVRVTDIIDLDPSQSADSGTIQTILCSYRPDVALLPPAAYIFSTLPTDKTDLDEAVFDAIPALHSVADRRSPAFTNRDFSFKGMGYEELPGRQDPNPPLTYVAPLRSEEAEAFVVAAQFASVAYIVDYGISFNNVGPVPPIQDGQLQLTSSSVIELAAKTLDRSGDTHEWFDAEVDMACDFYSGREPFFYHNPPGTTVIGRVIGEEPLMAGVVLGSVKVLGLYNAGVESGMDDDDIMRRIHNLEIH